MLELKLYNSVVICFVAVSFIAKIFGSPVDIPIRMQESGAEETCPAYLQGNTSIPCWLLENKCYCFADFRLRSWMRSDEFCRAANMTLITIETENEDKLINNHVKTHPALNLAEYWTAGRYSQEGNNRWEWASTEPFQPFNYTNWHPVYNQPNSNAPGSCALLYFLDTTGFWCDNDCIYSTKFICESLE